MAEFAAGLGVLRGRGVASRALGWSLVTWALGVAYHAALLSAFGLSLPITAAVLVLVATNLGMVVPSAPSYLGVYHFLCVLALGAFGVPGDLALAYAVVAHGLTFAFVTVAGSAALVCGGSPLGRWRTEGL
jgi:uncharacterized membrane protein YbhN (UPF0104 family)